MKNFNKLTDKIKIFTIGKLKQKTYKVGNFKITIKWTTIVRAPKQKKS